MLSEAGSVYWSFADVEEALVEAAELWLRTPSVGFSIGRGPFATDGPWELLTRQARAESLMDAWKLEQEAVAALQDGRPRAAGLSQADVARRDQVSAWVEWVAEGDRRLVMLAVTYQARGGRRVDWVWVMGKLGVKRGRDGLRMRYNRAITAIARKLTARGVALAA